MPDDCYKTWNFYKLSFNTQLTLGFKPFDVIAVQFFLIILLLEKQNQGMWLIDNSMKHKFVLLLMLMKN